MVNGIFNRLCEKIVKGLWRDVLLASGMRTVALAMVYRKDKEDTH